MNERDAADFRLPTTVIFSDLDGQMVLLNLKSEQYFGLDEVGANIIKHLLAEPVGHALDALGQEYNVDADVLRRDVERLVGELLDVGLIERVSVG